MKKQTTMKWFSGICAAVTAASFIGFVQSNPPNVVNAGSNGDVANYSHSDEGDQAGSDHDRGYYEEEDVGEYDHDSDNSGTFGQDDGQFNQGFQPSERRTRHS